MSPDDDDAPLLVLLPSRREPSDNTALSPRMLKRPYADFRGLVQLGKLFDLALQPPRRLGTGGRLVVPSSETAGKVAEEGAHRVGRDAGEERVYVVVGRTVGLRGRGVF